MKPIILFVFCALFGFAGLAQVSSAEEDFILNNVALNQLGNVARINQIGDFNEVNILQDNIQYAELLQQGDFNVMQARMTGTRNSLKLVQDGDNNSYELALDGDNNILGVIQRGYNNVLLQEMDKTDNRLLYLLQDGNNNYLEYRENDSFQPDLPLQITQEGQGLQLIINPKNHN
ncbi:MAG: hypothetical protein DHS20C18_47760 [Saprospiraceae bacterium]|nr:MAG: hypothetical protein DHS20C18_47760 [Saprospiraceae bacterium]